MTFLSIANGFLNDGWRDGLLAGEIVVTVLGFVVALWRIRKVGSVAKEARKAAMEARQEIRRGVKVGQARSAGRLVGEIQSLLLSKRWEAAMLRLTDLRGQLVEMREVVEGGMATNGQEEYWSSVRLNRVY